MQIYTMQDDDTTSQITNWATAKYGNVAPSLNSYAEREGGYSDPYVNTAALSMPAPSWGSATAPANSWSAYQTPPAPTVSTTQIDPSKLATRTVDANKETVSGQINSLLSENSPVLQQARNDALRTANDRGMLNSTMAASGGTDAVIRSAAQIGAQNAATWGNAADYNTALKNQSTMWNADQENQATRLYAQLQADTASRAQALELARMQDASTRYNTDLAYRKDVDNQKLGVANNIIANMELSPDRKAALLEQLGFGTMARNGQSGTGLAGAAFVIDSVGQELRSSGGGGVMGRMAQIVNAKAREGADRKAWGSGRATNSSDDYYYNRDMPQ